MHHDQTTLQRAFELARSGTVRNVAEIRRKLSTEGWDAVQQHLAGAGISKQLAELIAERVRAGR